MTIGPLGSNPLWKTGSYRGNRSCSHPLRRVWSVTAIPREVSEVFVKDADDAYALELWCADSYWWSSSIGLSNVEPELILRFGRYLSKILSRERLRLRIYEVDGIDDRVLRLTERVSVRPSHKMKRTAYHVYVNSRPLVRHFFEGRRRLSELDPKWVGPYIAGRLMATAPSGVESESHIRPKRKRC